MNETGASITRLIRVEFDYSPTVNFAMHQNDVPLIRRIRVTNSGLNAVVDLQIRVTGEPELFPAWETMIAKVGAGADS